MSGGRKAPGVDYVTMPGKALDAACFISAILGCDPDTTTPTALDEKPGGSAWWTPQGKPECFCCLEWHNEDGTVNVKLEPDIHDNWKEVWPILGYCAYHGITWSAP